MTFLHSFHTKTNELKPEKSDRNHPSCHHQPGMELAITLFPARPRYWLDTFTCWHLCDPTSAPGREPGTWETANGTRDGGPRALVSTQICPSKGGGHSSGWERVVGKQRGLCPPLRGCLVNTQSTEQGDLGSNPPSAQLCKPIPAIPMPELNFLHL